jgi:uncharacterized surface protein with fasciclin (FAS1) repeats
MLAFVLAAPATTAQTADAYQSDAQDIVATLDAEGTFTVLVSALRDTGLDAALASGETFTVFAPTDEAFRNLPAGTLEGLSPEQLTEILRYHVLVGAVPSQDALALDSAPTVQGGDLALSTADGQLYVNGAAVTAADLEASNGVIHVIDAVLMPEAEMDHDAMEDGSMEEKMGDDSAMEMEDDGTPTPAPEN